MHTLQEFRNVRVTMAVCMCVALCVAMCVCVGLCVCVLWLCCVSVGARIYAIFEAGKSPPTALTPAHASHGCFLVCLQRNRTRLGVKSTP